MNEDFAVESMAGDIFQLGNASWRILRVNSGAVRVEDAHGQPPGIPFLAGRSARPHERAFASGLAACASRWRTKSKKRSAAKRDVSPRKPSSWLECGKRPDATPARGSSRTTSPRFTAPWASSLRNESSCWSAFSTSPEACSWWCIRRSAIRVNRAWGLALRKRFCRSFNFELQAAATDDAIVAFAGHAAFVSAR